MMPVQTLIITPISSLTIDATKRKGNIRSTGDSADELSEIDSQLYLATSSQSVNQTTPYDDETTLIYNQPFIVANAWANLWPMTSTRQFLGWLRSTGRLNESDIDEARQIGVTSPLSAYKYDMPIDSKLHELA